MRGRKPKTMAQKLAKGERRPSRVNYDEPEVPAPAPDALAPPKDLKGAGLVMWVRYAQAMVDSGQLRTTDMPLFLQRCRTESDVERWEKEKRGRGVGRSDRLSIERVLNQFKGRALREAAELGMTSVSRSRVRSAVKPPVEKPKHARFFGAGGLKLVDGGRQ